MDGCAPTFIAPLIFAFSRAIRFGGTRLDLYTANIADDSNMRDQNAVCRAAEPVIIEPPHRGAGGAFLTAWSHYSCAFCLQGPRPLNSVAGRITAV
ncbi:MAG TPA: hypothetical protein VNI02_22255 [Blastocatellia bacterium]|jgi:hypothetical protein|nr:hypothetical protein [Blastocatellia bacterium]